MPAQKEFSQGRLHGILREVARYRERNLAALIDNLFRR
jgi:hypothetical protein